MELPLAAEAVQLTSTCESVPMPETAVGASGWLAGVTAVEGSDGRLAPTELAAMTVKV